ncbi:MAG TPA: type II secretion system protein [Candidatus Dormibacteraeota bacterium]
MTRKRGVSLIETMVAIALLAIIVVSILSAFSAITIAAARHRQQTTLDLLTRSDAEYIKSQAYSPSPAVYTNLVAGGFAFSYQVSYWDPVLGFAAGNPDLGLQQLVLTVNGPNGARETLIFLKAEP